MDNVTHTLAGLVLAESAIQLRSHRFRESPSARFRTVAAVSSAIAANLPDADLAYTGWNGDPLRYLLHHRGYTHTVVIAVLTAALVWIAALVFWRWRARELPPRDDARWLAALLLISVLSHLALDWTNSYGVHLFWPFDNRWQYGDAVFIIEPWLWVVSVPALAMASPRRVSKVLLSLALLAVLAVAWRVDLVTAGAATALTLGSLAFIGGARLLTAGRRIALAAGSWLAVTIVMGASASVARGAVRAAVQGASPGAEILDVVVTPAPANPVCASIITVERAGDVYRVASARVSNAPSITTARSCPSRNAAPASGQPRRPSTSRIDWDGEWTAAASELASMAGESCTVLASLRFMRVPVWTTFGDSVVIGDARFGGGSGGSFADVHASRMDASCPEAMPPWIPPRAELLGDAR